MRSAERESSSFNVDAQLHQGSALSPISVPHNREYTNGGGGGREELPEFMMFADDILLCGGKEVDMTEYLDTWRKSLRERGDG